MSQPQPPQQAKLIIGLFLSAKELLADLTRDLKAAFGDVDMVSPWFSFNYTEYYKAEMGHPLHRRMLVFKELIAQEALAQVKLVTNELENRYTQNGRRRVNIDPGYLLYERFVLATGKNYTHRIYIGDQIYADLTLIYQQGQYRPLPWTYPDYADSVMRSFLLTVRSKYGVDLKRLSDNSGKENAGGASGI